MGGEMLAHDIPVGGADRLEFPRYSGG
jgi:hypothetical protein